MPQVQARYAHSFCFPLLFSSLLFSPRLFSLACDSSYRIHDTLLPLPNYHVTSIFPVNNYHVTSSPFCPYFTYLSIPPPSLLLSSYPPSLPPYLLLTLLPSLPLILPLHRLTSIHFFTVGGHNPGDAGAAMIAAVQAAQASAIAASAAVRSAAGNIAGKILMH